MVPPKFFRYYSEENHANAFLENGEVLFRTLSYLKNLEATDEARGDLHEGTLVHRPMNGLQITKVETSEVITLPHSFESSVKANEIFIYCVSTDLSSTIAERLKAVIAIEILDPFKLLMKIRNGLSLRKKIRTHQLMHNSVRYCELDEPSGVDWALPDRIAMRKSKSFEWQKEYRFVVPAGDAFRVENVDLRLAMPNTASSLNLDSQQSLRLKLGNLKNICRVHKF